MEDMDTQYILASQNVAQSLLQMKIIILFQLKAMICYE